MRDFSNILAAALIAVAFAAPATAAGYGGRGGSPGGGDAGATVFLPPGGAGGPPAQGPSGGKPVGSGPGRHGSNVVTPHNLASPNSVAGRGADHNWRRHRRRYWPGAGPPILVPEPSGEYTYGGEDFYDESDSSGCWVYRKVYDRSRHFLGWARVDLCQGQ